MTELPATTTLSIIEAPETERDSLLRDVAETILRSYADLNKFGLRQSEIALELCPPSVSSSVRLQLQNHISRGSFSQRVRLHLYHRRAAILPLTSDYPHTYWRMLDTPNNSTAMSNFRFVAGTQRRSMGYLFCSPDRPNNNLQWKRYITSGNRVLEDHKRGWKDILLGFLIAKCITIEDYRNWLGEEPPILLSSS